MKKALTLMEEDTQSPVNTQGKKSRPYRDQEVCLTIERLSQGGKGVARHEGFVLFIPLTAPKDRIRARVTKTRRRHGDAEIIDILSPSPDRTTPPCRYFGFCGGCAWQHLTYTAQLEANESIILECFDRLTTLSGELPFLPIVPAEETLNYRNKMEFSFHPDSILGLHKRGFFDQVIEINQCLLPSTAASRLLVGVKSFVREHELTRWSTKSQFGLLRHLIIRESRGSGEIMVGLITTSDPFPLAKELAQRLVTIEPRVSSVVRAINDSTSDAVCVESMEILHGHEFIHETLGGIPFRVELETFFQTNTAQAEKMVHIVKEMSDLSGSEQIVDLFCGVGTFALLLAPHARKVFGLEVVDSAIQSARKTASACGISNVEFSTGDARRGLPKLLDKLDGSPDLLLLDPPRSGAGGKVMRRIGRSRAQRVVYISCNPGTLAPDLEWLVPFGYEIKAIQPIDLFPQTHHVETIVRLDRRSDADDIPDPFKK